MIIGLCGAARSGKDLFASLLKEESGQAVSMQQIAGPLKAYVRDLFDWTEEHTDGDLKDKPDKRSSRPCARCTYPGHPKPGLINTAIDIMGFSTPRWEKCPVCRGEKVIYLTPRHAMQQLGGEFAAATSPNIYAVRAAGAALQDVQDVGLGIITDCRFLHDIEAVKAVGGVIVEVVRDEDPMTKVGSHTSETARLDPEFQALVDYRVINDGTIEELRHKAADLWAKLMHSKWGVEHDIERGPRPGDWIESLRFGPCVLIENRGDHYALRYKARHLQSQGIIWVGTTDSVDACKLLRRADKTSRHVLTLTGSAPFEGSSS